MMKKFKQLMEGLPPKKIVFAFGRFQPPTIGHELLVKTVKKIAEATADHVIYASRTQDAKKNPLAVERKVYYLKRMFPGMNFAAANDEQRTFMEVAAALNKKYKHIVMVAGSDRIADYKRILNNYNGKDFNFESIEVVSAGERDPDADNASGMSGTKMREAAKKGDFKLFKTGLPHTITDLDARRLMNELRKASGLQPVKESLNIVVDELREKYFRGEIFNVGDTVTCNEEFLSIVKRGSNHLLVKAEDGSLHSKWIHEVQVAEDFQIRGDDMQDEYDFSKGTRGAVLKEKEEGHPLTSKTLKPNDKIKVARVIASMLGVENPESMSNPDQLVNTALRKLKSKALNPESVNIVKRMLELANEVGINYDEKLLQSKLKEEDEMQSILKFREFHKKDHLRKMKRNYQLGEENLDEVGNTAKGQKMLAKVQKRATDRLIKADDKNRLEPDVSKRDLQTVRKNAATAQRAYDRLKEEDELDVPVLENEETWAQRVIDEEDVNNNALPLHADAQFPEDEEDFEEISDEEIDAMVNSMTDEDIMEHGYDDNELAVIDDDTGEEVELDDDPVKEAALMEVLSRLERIKARARFRRTEAKRERRLSIALKKTSNTQTINRRARRMAIKALKQRFARKPVSKLSVAEKERLEQRIQRMKPVLNRIAMRMAPRVRRLERDRIRK